MRGYPIALETPSTRDVPTDLPLCCKLERIAGDARLGRATLLGMPWFSPILGSGCLDLGDGPDLRPAALKGLRKAIDGVVADSGRAAELEDAVGAFVQSLIDARAPGMRANSVDGGSGAEEAEGEAASRLVIVAALLTRAFHQGSLQVGRPIGQRFMTSVVPLPSAAHEDPEADLRGIVRTLVAQMSQPDRLSDLAGYWKDETFWRALTKHLMDELDRSDADGNPEGAVAGFDVQLLTELAWLTIVKDSALYPGWSDLLVGLMGSAPEAGHARGIRRTPKQLDNEIAKQVEGLLDPVTRRSWKSRQSIDDEEAAAENRDRRTFYSQIASLLGYQADFRAILNPTRVDTDEESDDLLVEQEEAEELVKAATATRIRLTNEVQSRAKKEAIANSKQTEWPVPLPLAVVTSFDIELEMAFWSQKIPFVVILPMLASPTSSSQHGSVVWLAAKFDPSTDEASEEDFQAFQASVGQTEREDDMCALTQLLNLRKGRRRWVPAPEVTYGGSVADWSNLPTIIRLSGSPLMQVSLADGDDSKLVQSYGGISPTDHFELIHALTIDEYSGLRLSAHEIYALAVQGFPFTALPASMLTGTDPMPRVWVSFGVQVDDPAIRMRLFSQLSVASVYPTLSTSAQGGASSTEDRGAGERSVSLAAGTIGGDSGRVAAGLAINRRFSDADAAVMRWLGFEFAEVDVHTLVQDLHHYTEHVRWARDQLRGDDLGTWPGDRVYDGEGIAQAAPDRRHVLWGRATENSCRLLKNGGRQ